MFRSEHGKKKMQMQTTAHAKQPLPVFTTVPRWRKTLSDAFKLTPTQKRPHR